MSESRRARRARQVADLLRAEYFGIHEIVMEFISRQSAIRAGSTRYFTGNVCPHGHIDERLVSDFSCVACNRIKTKKRLKEYPEIAKRRIKKHYTNFPHKLLARTANRRAAKDQRTPPWLDDIHRMEIESIYVYCKSMRDIGIKMAVDHIVPLRGKSVSGLHVPWNLQLLHEMDNSRKGNRYA